MRRHQLLGLAAATTLSALLVSGGIAIAQNRAPGTADAPATAGLTRQVNLTPQEQIAQSDGFLSRMDGTRLAVRRQLETARANRDVVKTLCLNDKLNQLDVAIRSARERRGNLEAAATRHDTDLTNHEFTIMTVLRQRAEQLNAEANQCVGNDSAFFPASEVTSTVDPNLPNEDPTTFPPGGIIVQPPACSSCFK